VIYKDGDIISTGDGVRHRVLYATKRDNNGQHITLKVRSMGKPHKGYTVDTNRIVECSRKGVVL
jgi:hypothetical protein